MRKTILARSQQREMRSAIGPLTNAPNMAPRVGTETIQPCKSGLWAIDGSCFACAEMLAEERGASRDICEAYKVVHDKNPGNDDLVITKEDSTNTCETCQEEGVWLPNKLFVTWEIVRILIGSGNRQSTYLLYHMICRGHPRPMWLRFHQ
jgi:hypothetical protein